MFLIFFQLLLIAVRFFSLQFYTAIKLFLKLQIISIMKRFLQLGFVAIAALMVTAYSSKAQTTGTVTLNCVLNNVTSITIGASFQTTALTYTTAADYTNGVTTNQTAALTAISNQAYSVKVIASQDLTNNTNTIPIGDVTITPSFTGTNSNITCTAKALSKTVTNTIISSSVGTTSQAYNLEYSTVGAPSSDFLGKPAVTYTSTLTYTITNP